MVLLRGDLSELSAAVLPIDDAPSPQCYLMLLRPALFTTVADRLLRALTCAEVWPELGDLATCQQTWQAEPIANQPRDPERFQLAMNMAMLAALVILYHELAHILRGHSAYWSAQSADAGLGMAALRENKRLAMSQTGDEASEPDLTQRAIEADADLYAGQFVAAMLKLGALGEVNDDNVPHWCELVGFVATLTFNAFEANASRAGYTKGYHLPSTRTECFLEGVARGLAVEGPEWFAPGVNAGFEFCAQHYQAPPSLSTIEADVADLQQKTWPLLTTLRPQFYPYVPAEWLARQEQA